MFGVWVSHLARITPIAPITTIWNLRNYDDTPTTCPTSKITVVGFVV